MIDDESEVKNVFDSLAVEDGKVVPVVIEVGEGKRQVGEATIEVGDGVIYANMTLKNDDPYQVAEFLRGGITSISAIAPDISEAETEALFEFEPHRHDPVQHRDGREPWCDICGLSIRLDKPKGRLGKPEGNFGFPKPSYLHDKDGDTR